MVTKVQNYQFDGDPDGLKYVQLLDQDEFETLRYCINGKGEAHIFDSRKNFHFEITKSTDGIYMISKVQPPSSSWF